ncbi:hypothetical protein BGZ82_002776 [Podila clonocystis]|nr:hypothetical protein BGZ82_002776 [Podila clonocystis]
MAEHIDPASFNHKFATTCGHNYHYVEEGDPNGEPLLLVHGFPDMWYGWRHQIRYLAKQGYRVIAPDCLGYGQSSNPHDSDEYSLKKICTHLVGLLDALSIPKITLIGHDWGGAIVWRFGLHYPSRVHGIISVCTPYTPPLKEYVPLEETVKKMPEFEYQLALADPNSTPYFESIIDKFMDGVGKQGHMPQQDVDYLVAQYKNSGMQGPLNYYRTRKINFEEEKDLPHIIEAPSAIIVALRDPYLKPYQSEKMHKFVPSLKRVMIDAEHFVLTEKPDEINALIKELLEDVKSRRVKSVL